MAWSKNDYFKIFNYYIFLRIIKTPKNAYREIPIKEIFSKIGASENKYSYSSSPYDWEGLEKDIKENGLKNRINVTIVEKRIFNKNKKLYRYDNGRQGYKYEILDGEHRLCVMKKLYGEKYKIKSNSYTTINSFG